MGIPNYIRQANNGVICIDCNKVPSTGFIDAVKTKDIIKFKVMSSMDKMNSTNYTPGGPDVVVQHITGETQMLTRRELSKSYVHTSGNKIRLSILRNGKQYLAYNICNENYKIMKLPNNCAAILPDGKQTKCGSYIIAKADGNGAIDKNSITSVSSSVFKKMFKIPMQSVIKRNMNNRQNSGSFKLLSREHSKTRGNFGQRNRTKFNSAAIGMNPAKVGTPVVQNNNNNKGTFRPQLTKVNNNSSNRGTFTPTMNTNMNRQNTTNYQYTVVAKIVDIDKHLMGFVVRDIRTNKTRNLKVNELTQLCINRLVDNVMVVRNQKGNMYLKGNGCSIENMREVIM